MLLFTESIEDRLEFFAKKKKLNSGEAEPVLNSGEAEPVSVTTSEETE